MAKPAPILALSAVVFAAIGLLTFLLATDQTGEITVPVLSLACFGMAALSGVGLVVLWGVADMLNQHRELIERSIRELPERRL